MFSRKITKRTEEVNPKPIHNKMKTKWTELLLMVLTTSYLNLITVHRQQLLIIPTTTIAFTQVTVQILHLLKSKSPEVQAIKNNKAFKT